MATVTILITSEKIDLNRVANWGPEPYQGASNTFVGFVRSRNLGRDVVAVEYDCYTTLCEKIFNDIATEAAKKWDPNSRILIIHRHGHLMVGEASVAIAATTGHRDESYKITRYIIEEIKERAPIWKKEFYTDGATDWVRGHALCQHRKIDHHGHHNHLDDCGNHNKNDDHFNQSESHQPVGS